MKIKVLGLEEGSDHKVSIPNSLRKETAAQIPMLAKNPSITAIKINIAINLNIFFTSLAILLAIVLFFRKGHPAILHV